LAGPVTLSASMRATTFMTGTPDVVEDVTGKRDRLSV
jgi:hypothetical protein